MSRKPSPLDCPRDGSWFRLAIHNVPGWFVVHFDATRGVITDGATKSFGDDARYSVWRPL